MEPVYWGMQGFGFTRTGKEHGNYDKGFSNAGFRV